MGRLLLGQLVNQLPTKGLLPPDSQTTESQTELGAMITMFKDKTYTVVEKRERDQEKHIENEGNEQKGVSHRKPSRGRVHSKVIVPKILQK